MGFSFGSSNVVFFFFTEEINGLKYSWVKFNALNMFETISQGGGQYYSDLARCEEKILQTRDSVILPECLQQREYKVDLSMQIMVQKILL